MLDIKASKGAKIRNRYNQVPHLTIKLDIKFHFVRQWESEIKTLLQLCVLIKPLQVMNT